MRNKGLAGLNQLRLCHLNAGDWVNLVWIARVALFLLRY